MVQQKETTSQAILLAVLLACLLPFINKAYHIDDTLFLAAARHIQSDPFNFYNFSINWYGYDMPMYQVMKNPPLTAYYLALVTAVFGWHEAVVHGALLIPAIFVATGTFRLANHLCSRPLLAALAGLLTPVFLVSATNVMCDIMMLAFWVWAVHFWVQGLDSNKTRYLLISAFLIACGSLTKYFGMCLIPMLLAYTVYKKRAAGMWLLVFIIPVAALALYNWGTLVVYGKGLLLDAGAYAQTYRKTDSLFKQAMSTLLFTGGCVVTYFFFSVFLWRRYLAIAGAVLGAGVMMFFLAETVNISALSFAEKIWVVLQFSLMAIAGLSLIAVCFADLWQERSAESLLLFLWITGTFAFAGFVNWSINGRSILPMVPAAGIVLARALDRKGVSGYFSEKKFLAYMPLLPGLLLSLLVVHADYSLADTSRQAARKISALGGATGGRAWFQGHWGFQYYMEKAGWKPLTICTLTPGDIVVTPLNNTNVIRLPKEAALYRQTYSFKPAGYATTMYGAGAGFYSSAIGPFPFVLSSAPPQDYQISQVFRTLQLK